MFASSKYPGPTSVRDYESVFADAVYQKQQLEDQLHDVSQFMKDSKSRKNTPGNKPKDSAIFYTVPLKGGEKYCGIMKVARINSQ